MYPQWLMGTDTIDKLEMALNPPICFTSMNDVTRNWPGLLQLFHLCRSQGSTVYLEIFRQMECTVVFLGRSIVCLSTLFLQSLIIWVEYLTSSAMSLGMFWFFVRRWDYIKSIQIPRTSSLYELRQLENFGSWAYGWLYFNDADFI